jgi:hypothetical protein
MWVGPLCWATLKAKANLFFLRIGPVESYAGPGRKLVAPKKLLFRVPDGAPVSKK